MLISFGSLEGRRKEPVNVFCSNNSIEFVHPKHNRYTCILKQVDAESHGLRLAGRNCVTLGVPFKRVEIL